MVAGQEAITASEFVELAFGLDEAPLGVDRELFAGVLGESEQERAARLDVAREVLAELRASHPRDAAFAEALMRSAPLPLRRPSAAERRSLRSGVAA
ncbi:hypothetical protein [Wenjunlia tyrosinilytica]|uniref:Uncharacterized protein n=1 Tax=Wenjunlia tyrosinilytica TaxID=1544741 RepID=A0A918DWG6_9ACTN|nr:hypothetical protein [Wenjunlia tyrosinilytica]GGO86699.1 hypothetical protein GCM10012280_23440 [Wenjunlia tyrosinilytica]